jgi:hypothetical protein
MTSEVNAFWVPTEMVELVSKVFTCTLYQDHKKDKRRRRKEHIKTCDGSYSHNGKECRHRFKRGGKMYCGKKWWGQFLPPTIQDSFLLKFLFKYRQEVPYFKRLEPKKKYEEVRRTALFKYMLLKELTK